jgi:hypothetical protein
MGSGSPPRFSFSNGSSTFCSMAMRRRMPARNWRQAVSLTISCFSPWICFYGADSWKSCGATS